MLSARQSTIPPLRILHSPIPCHQRQHWLQITQHQRTITSIFLVCLALYRLDLLLQLQRRLRRLYKLQVLTLSEKVLYQRLKLHLRQPTLCLVQEPLHHIPYLGAFQSLPLLRRPHPLIRAALRRHTQTISWLRQLLRTSKYNQVHTLLLLQSRSLISSRRSMHWSLQKPNASKQNQYHR